MKLIVDGNDISQFYNEITWSGDKGQAARQMDFGVVVSGTDKNLPTLTINMNATAKLINEEGVVLFDGYVFSKEKSIDNNIMSVTCLDKLILANKSKGTFNFEKKTPDAIAKEAFGSIGLSVGKAESGSPIDRKFDLETIYNVVFTAYKMENEKTGKPYIIRMNNGNVDIVEQGKIVAKYVLDGKSNLYNATYGENSENVVSKVKMFDTEGKEIGEVTNNVEGGIVEVYRQEKDEDPEARAKGMLKDIERAASVRVKGDFDLITGNAVIIKEPFTGLNGKFYIISDKHTFANNYHVVDLELSFDNIMGDIDTSTDSESGSTGNTSGVNPNGSTGQKAIQIGESIKGTHYKWGGTDPKTGVDCSGFVTWAFKQAGANIPGRITSAGIRSNPKALGFKEIPFNERQPGDVLWQKGHVAMQYDATRIIESGGVSKRIMGYSGVCVSNQKGRTFSKAYRYVGG
ncbi:MAG: C40 family peptidase [Peptoniphilus sp.]|uniref:XkdQ/YqbQ family protein n=1 Tax=Peptoniphilus sp. TaxID=1971214 RepID=UPI0025DF8F8B|nr:NlpC/P60 family protein [Peptoniphilus sp.]MCI5643839.1 C40 family peptidase [Peptoniphilus sp.]